MALAQELRAFAARLEQDAVRLGRLTSRAALTLVAMLSGTPVSPARLADAASAEKLVHGSCVSWVVARPHDPSKGASEVVSEDAFGPAGPW